MKKEKFSCFLFLLFFFLVFFFCIYVLSGHPFVIITDSFKDTNLSSNIFFVFVCYY